MLNVILLFSECCYAKCRYVECHVAPQRVKKRLEDQRQKFWRGRDNNFQVLALKGAQWENAGNPC
jgi:hypothetical protein